LRPLAELAFISQEFATTHLFLQACDSFLPPAFALPLAGSGRVGYL
jgi:hypothetical protein